MDYSQEHPNPQALLPSFPLGGAIAGWRGTNWHQLTNKEGKCTSENTICDHVLIFISCLLATILPKLVKQIARGAEEDVRKRTIDFGSLEEITKGWSL